MKIAFLTGSQYLYGEETLKAVEKDSEIICGELDANAPRVEIVYKGTVKTENDALNAVKEINYDDEIAGVMVWCHTFSPAKMWINALKILLKPLLHLHTQFNERLPYAEIDMDFMNLNQSAHGDREFGYILNRLRINHTTVVGYYKEPDVMEKINKWADFTVAEAFSKQLKIARFGDNMREVAVTEGDKVEANIKFGWTTDYFAVGDLVEEINSVTDAEKEALFTEYADKYLLNTSDLEAVKEQAKYEIALRRFLNRGGYRAFTTNFQDLYGLKQLPGLAVQRLSASGYGFGAEGDWKTAALVAVFKKMGEKRKGVSVFMEDYTYDLKRGEELVLGSHMLEVDPQAAKTKPKIEVHPLGIGGKEAPARLVFDGIEGAATATSLIDTGLGFKLITAEIELVSQPEKMPKLPLGRLMWRVKPNFKDGVRAWLNAGGAHHTVVSTALDAEDIETFALANGAQFEHIG